MDSGTRSSSLRSAAARLAGVAVVAALAVGLAPSTASAAPRRPSDTQIANAQTQADAVAARIGELSGRLAAAQDAVEAAHATSVIALDAYQATQTSYELARRQADDATAAAAEAAADLAVARDDVVAFARRSFMQGSTYSGAAALITAADPGDLVQRAALLEAAGAHRFDVLEQVVILEAQAVEAERTARSTMNVAAALQEQAAAELGAAQRAEVFAREQAAALTAEQASLESELAAAQTQLATLVGARAAADRTAQLVRPAAPPPPTGIPSTPSGNQSPAGAGNSAAAARAIDAATAYIGLPYAWGGGGSRGPGPGQDPDEGIIGFDCSGLTQYAYAQAGITIPRNSRAQYAALPKVSSSELRPGDLVFWATDTSDPSTIHHVAIWLGGDRILEAQQSGTLVKTSGMRWKGYIGAARPSA